MERLSVYEATKKSFELPVDQTTFGVLGYGSWATALLKILAHQQYPVHWYLRKEDDRRYVLSYRHNPRYLSSVALSLPAERLHTDPVETVRAADVLLLATPAFLVESLLESIPNDELKDKMLVSAIKGVLPDKQMTVSQYLRLYKEVPSEQIATITGPCHAEEVAQEKLSYLTFSSPRLEMAQQLGRFFHCHYVQPTCTTDAGGAEMGAVLKNVYALAAGMAHGLGYGDNFTAVLVANAAREMQAFLHTLDAHPSEVLETTYLGDLLVTAYSQFSRNRTFGAMVGRGYSVRSAQLEMGMVAEGYYAVGVVLALNEARKQVDMPICRAVHEVLYQQGDARSVFAGLARQLS